MTQLDIRFSDWIQKGLALFMDHAVLLILCGVVSLALITLTAGLLAGPMLAGLAFVVRTLQDERLARPTVNDLFRGFDHFMATIPVTIGLYILALISFVLHFIPGPGFVLNTVVVSVGSATLILPLFHLLDRKVPPRESIPVWWEMFKQNWGPLLGFYILLALIGGIGALVLYVGLVITVPLYMCILGTAYNAIRKQSAGV